MPFDTFFDHISTGLGVPPDHIKMVVSVLLTYPYAVIFNHLPDSPTIKHLFSIIITTITFVWFHGLYVGFAQLLSNALFVYFFMKYNKGKWAPLVVFVLTMMHMSYSQITRQMKGYLGDDNFDHTAPQMVLTMKLTAFAFNVYDGTKPVSTLSDYQRSNQVRTYPTLLSFLGWVFFFGGFLAGPAFEFSDYVNFIDSSVFAITDEKTGKTKIVKPNGTWPALEKLSVSLVCAALLTALGPHFNILDAAHPVWMARPFWYKIIFVQIVSFCVRLKYYTIWLMAEGACIMCGLSFNGYDPATGKAKWNRMPNIDILAYEKAQNVKELLEAWNMRTNVWLKNYVYLRVTQPGKKPGFTSTLVTFGTSALWHGFHPGYYLTFITGALLQNTGKHLRRYLRPLVFTPDLKQALPIKTAYDIAGYLLTQMAFNYTVMPFVILSFTNSVNLWRSLYFYTHVGILVIELFFAVGGKAWCQSVQKKRVEKAGLRLKEVPETNKVIVSETGIPETVTDGGIQVGKVKLQ
ncbi:membrane-bound O-acyltransferase domain-containing protein [Endogone sp. FLAS-F59071]|nr:membrane-bound O-acyltransferase domain-containing protein [Endogone sp. FLAS-F59071]|eukprot:RUS23259.1 membrane-bound O-acyltransferase domain-containing protein [Endogone sp. FLAS-F59071]